MNLHLRPDGREQTRPLDQPGDVIQPSLLRAWLN